MSLFQLKLREIHSQLADKHIKVEELVAASYEQITKTGDQIGAFITLNEEEAERQARHMDERLANGHSPGLLFGLPIAYNDNIVTEGLLTTCASRILANHLPIYDAAVVQKLKQAETVTIGKLNMDEFGMGGSNEQSAYHTTKNPWNHEYVPGGASGGAAAAVAARQVYFALGADSGGSVRLPASYCGVVGLKPTYGLVSRYGLVAGASSLDTIGPLAKNVEDAAYLLQAIAGYDEREATSVKMEIPDYVGTLHDSIRGMKIGVPQQYFDDATDGAVKEAVMASLNQLEDLGAEWEEMSMPHTAYAVSAYTVLAYAEASSNMARYDGVRYGVRATDAADLTELYIKSRGQGFGREVKLRILLGTYALSSGQYEELYVKAQKVRTLIREDFNQALQKYDVLLTPTTPTTAYKMGAQTDPLSMLLNERYTIPASLAGNPAISLPCGMADGLPIGLQIIGKNFDEASVLRVAQALEREQ